MSNLRGRLDRIEERILESKGPGDLLKAFDCLVTELPMVSLDYLHDEFHGATEPQVKTRSALAQFINGGMLAEQTRREAAGIVSTSRGDYDPAEASAGIAAGQRFADLLKAGDVAGIRALHAEIEAVVNPEGIPY